MKSQNLEQFWLQHSIAAESSNMPLTEYAKQHQLNIKAFYNWRSILRKKKLIPESNLPVSQSSFVKVNSSPDSDISASKITSDLQITVTLPNSIRIEFSTDDFAIGKLIQSVSLL